MTTVVSLIKGEERRELVRKALERIGPEIVREVGERQIVVKPNFVSTSIQLASTHVDQVKGILDFFKGITPRKIIIAESAAGDSGEAYKRFGYDALQKEFDVELVDLNQRPYRSISLGNGEGHQRTVRVSRLLLEEDTYLISAAKLKTHDAVVVTLSIKNAAMGGVLYPDKMKVHQGVSKTNRNIATLARYLWPDLAVIDGLEGMEGNGPISGKRIHVGVAIAGTDPLAVDRIGCEVMGVDFHKVGYLSHLQQVGAGEARLDEIHLIGSPLAFCVTPFRLHETVEEQYQWKSNEPCPDPSC